MSFTLDGLGKSLAAELAAAQSCHDRLRRSCGLLRLGLRLKEDRCFAVEPGKFFDRNWELSQFRNPQQSLNVAFGSFLADQAIRLQEMSPVVLTTRETELRMSLGDTHFETTPLLPVCCMCGLVRDEKSSAYDGGRWMTQQMYRLAHGVSPIDLALTHTYCPQCLAKTQQEVARAFLLKPRALQ